jgi:hypothetical protein
MPDQNEFAGSCFCGAVKISVTGAPEAMGFCHCESCRHWSAGPLNAFTLWKPHAVRMSQGADELSSYAKTPASTRKWCNRCGGHVLTEHPGSGVIDVYAATIPGVSFQPALHIHYGEAVLRIRDGLPKQQDLPKRWVDPAFSFRSERSPPIREATFTRQSWLRTRIAETTGWCARSRVNDDQRLAPQTFGGSFSSACARS